MAGKLEDLNIARGADCRAASGVDWAHEATGAGSRVAILPFKVREPLNESSTAFANIFGRCGTPTDTVHRHRGAYGLRPQCWWHSYKRQQKTGWWAPW